MKKIFIGLFLIVLVTAGVWIYRYYAPQNSTLTQNTVSVMRGDLEHLVTATGKLQPRDYVEVGAQVSGQLTQIHVEVGDEVEQDALLAEIDPTVYLASVDASRAQLRNLQAQLEDRQASLTLAQLQYTRQQNLIKTQVTSQEALQTAEANLRSARAQIQALKAQIEQTESSLRADEAKLNYARIFAPMTGTVVSIQARQGQTLNANQQAPVILQIADLSVMTVQAQVSEADVGLLTPGMSAYFTTLGDPQKRWYGELRRIEPTPVIESNVVLYNALFDVPNEGGRLLPQMTAQVFFIRAQAQDALMLPLSAVSFIPGSTHPQGRPARVRVLTEQGEEVREILTGVSNRVQIQVKEGLQEGDKVLLSNPAGSANRTAASAGAPGVGPMSGPRMR